MSGINISVDDSELQKVYDALKKYPKSAERAIVRTVNDTAQRTLSPLKKDIASKYNIKQKDLSGGSQYKGESSNNLVKVRKTNNLIQPASISVRGGYLTLMRFVKGNKMPTNKKGRRVSVQVRKGHSVRMSQYNFLQFANGGRVQVFQRHSDSRKISRLLKTISVAHMASNKDVSNNAQETANEILKKRSQHYIELEMKKIKGGNK